MNSDIRLLIFIGARVFRFACNMFSIVKSVRVVKSLLVVKIIIKYANIGIVAKYYDNNESRRFQFNLSYLEAFVPNLSEWLLFDPIWVVGLIPLVFKGLESDNCQSIAAR